MSRTVRSAGASMIAAESAVSVSDILFVFGVLCLVLGSGVVGLGDEGRMRRMLTKYETPNTKHWTLSRFLLASYALRRMMHVPGPVLAPRFASPCQALPFEGRAVFEDYACARSCAWPRSCWRRLPSRGPMTA